MRFKDRPFSEPILARFASEGTLKLLAYLTLLTDPEPPQLIGIEEPENFLHPRLLEIVAEECIEAAGRTQLFVTTHAPEFVNSLRADEVWVLARDKAGYTRARRAGDMPMVPELLAEGARLGQLWSRNVFEWGDPLAEPPG